MARRNYDTESKRLLTAIDCAIHAITSYPAINLDSNPAQHILAVYAGWKQDILHPHALNKNLRILDAIAHDAFTYFQEATGKDVDYFWEQVRQLGLGYERRDLLRHILQAGKIKNQLEYDYVVDTLVPAQQEGRITEAEAYTLSDYIGRFEAR